MKRILLFVLTNLAVMVVLGVVASLLGVNRFLTANGLNLTSLLGFSLIMGFGGAIISLLISKPMAKWTSGVKVIHQPASADEAWIVDTVRKFADKSGIGMPESNRGGVYHAGGNGGYTAVGIANGRCDHGRPRHNDDDSNMGQCGRQRDSSRHQRLWSIGHAVAEAVGPLSLRACGMACWKISRQVIPC